MKKMITEYEIAPLIRVEVTRYPRSKMRDIELIIGGEGQTIYRSDVEKIFKAVLELKNDLRIKV